MAAKKVTITLDETLVEALAGAAKEEGIPLSGLIAGAAERELRLRTGRTVLQEWQREHGAFTPDELTAARADCPDWGSGSRPGMITGMDDWARFLDAVSWFVKPRETVEVGESRLWSRGAVSGLPALSELLQAAAVTPVAIDGRAYELLAWGGSAQRRGWLCLPSPASPSAGLNRVHGSFLAVCGGILEQFGEPASWWNNMNEVLTEEAAATPFPEMLDAYAWLWDDEGLTIPIEPSDFYVVAVEANGNLTLVHRSSGELVLFATDHDFDGVTPLPGCPPHSLMSIDELPDLTTWLESTARSWSAR